MPLGTDPGVLDPAEFIHEILTVRYPNPFLPDTPQRITTDTSQKVATRYGETLMNYYNSKVPMHKVTRLRFIPLAIAGWLRYLIALDDKGEPITLSPDPAMDLLQEALRGVKLGDPDSVCEEALYAILSDRMIFGMQSVRSRRCAARRLWITSARCSRDRALSAKPCTMSAPTPTLMS